MLSPTVYETLPYAYIGAGALNAMLLESPLKYLPTVLLIGAGLLIMAWRHSARTRGSNIQRRARRIRRPLAQPR